MESNLVIYTEKINCQDCYKCIKVCPVKSIKIEDFSASVINESCIFCGECINACPANAKKYRDDTHLILDWAINQEKMIASIAPSFLSDFGDEKLENILKAFYVLGFSAVSETALGAELVAVETNRVLKESDEDVVLATCCPSVVNYIKIHQPNLEKNLAPVVSPMIAHARQLRAAGYNNYKIVFVGPCIAKKRESDIYGDEVDAVITFQEFTALLEREGIFFSDMEKIELPEKFVIGASERAGLFPVDYGMISTMCREKESVDANFLSFSGMKAVMEVCSELKEWNPSDRVFVELMACDGGCIKGPATNVKEGVAAKRNRLLRGYDSFKRSKLATPFPQVTVPLNYHAYQVKSKYNHPYSDIEIQLALNSMGKTSKEDELNCSGCGYDNCREFAIALLEGKAEREMCISQMRKEAQNKASILLHKMPYGVVLVNEKMEIVDANDKFIKVGGEETLLIAETLGSLAGADLYKLVPYAKYFQSVLNSGEESAEFDLRGHGFNIKLSIVSIQPKKTVCGILHYLDDTQLIKELLSERIKEVIKQNAQSVQRIAYILGESASYTESVLNSVIDSEIKK